MQFDGRQFQSVEWKKNSVLLYKIAQKFLDKLKVKNDARCVATINFDQLQDRNRWHH